MPAICTEGPPPLLEAAGLGKRYGNTVALAGLDFRVGPGEIYALLGPNGAGKTTTLALFLGLARPSVGCARVGGLDVALHPLATRRLIGYLPEDVALYDQLTGLEHLQYFARLTGARAASRAELLDRLAQLGLPPVVAEARVRRYSKGMRQRVGLAIALVRDPPTLLLDEPLAGLDPSTAHDVAVLMRAQSARGVAILLTSHDLFRTRDLASRIGILSQGTLAVELPTDGLSYAELERVYLERARS